jgi:hypothetical protein
MFVKLFDVQNGKVVPTEHCYTLKTFHKIMENYPDNYLKIYQYLFYMTCPNPEINVYFNTPEDDKEELILNEIQIDISLDSDDIVEAYKLCEKLYETPTTRAYIGIKKALDNMASYMANTPITDGRDGNIAQVASVAKNFDSIRQSFKGVYQDLKEEQQQQVRGNKNLSYDS